MNTYRNVVTQLSLVMELVMVMESGLFVTLLGIFSTRGERYYFHVEGSTWGEIEMNIGKKTRNSEKLKFLFWVEGTFGGWGEVWEVGYVRWVTRGKLREVGFASHLVKFFIPWYFYYFWEFIFW